jgi:hypothetical protein
MLGLVLRGLGLVYVIAFTSLRVQIRGLHGSRGIVPIGPALDAVRRDPDLRDRPWRRWHALPTLLWLDASDRGLERWCALGQAAGLAMAAGVAPRLSAASAWALYLSFATVSDPFLSYQWDSLLLEAGLLGIVASPSGRRLRWRRGDLSPEVGATLFRLLTFRLHFESGIAKRQSGDATWRRGTAVAYHYETQPLPTPLAHRAHALPSWFQRASTTAVLALEIVGPFLVFGPRRARRVGFGLLATLQALIAATGNFAFFNLLTGVVSLSLLERQAGRAGRRARSAPHVLYETLAGETLATLAAEGLGLLQLIDLGRRVRSGRSAPGPWDGIEEQVAPFRPVGSYGLFAVMTRDRPEIVIEGSNDAREWLPYELPWKPGEPRRGSRFVAPHQPRLDWQLWFAALSPAVPPWFHALMYRLLEGSSDVLALFARNPFPGAPPRFVRAVLYDYRMTDVDTRHRTGRYWERRPLGLYYPAVGLSPADPSDRVIPRHAG